MKFLCLLITTYTLVLHTSLVRAQYGYIGDPKAACVSDSNAGIYVGYSCNAGAGSCKTNLTFRSQHPYNTLSNIARLLEVDYNDIAQANPNYNTDAVEWNKLVYVPITCSCQNSQYYYKYTRRVLGRDDSYLHMANNTYEGLTTCQAIKLANDLYRYPNNFVVGMTIFIPLRCACPTTNQRSSKIPSLFSYVVGVGETISSISTQLKVDNKSILEANQLPEDSTIYPFTTLLIPVINNQSTSEPAPKLAISKGAIGGIVAAGVAAIAGFTVPAIKFHLCEKIFCCNKFYELPDDERDRVQKTGKDRKRQKVPDDDAV